MSDTRSERKSALDEFAASAVRPETLPVVQHQGPLPQVTGAQAVAVYRDEAKVLQRLRAAAAAAGENWYYRFPVKNRAKGTTDWIEGGSIKLANDLARLYGNCEVDCRAQDLGDFWLFHARFIDLESGYALTRPFQQRKSGGKIGGGDDERRLDIAFQIGASKAIRNVVLNALQTYADFAFDEAKGALVDKIGKDLENYKRTTAERIAKLVAIERVEAVIGRPAKEWLAPDVAKVIAMGKAISDGMSSVDDTFPPLKPSEAKTETVLEKFISPTAGGTPQASGGVTGNSDTTGSDEPQADGSPPSAAEDNVAAGPSEAAPDDEPTPEQRRIEMKGHAITLVLRGAINRAIPPERRLDNLTEVHESFPDLSRSFLDQLVTTAKSVIKNELPVEKARAYLESLQP